MTSPETSDIKILRDNKNCQSSQGSDYKSFFPNILSFWINDVTDFPKVMSPPICHFRFSIFVIETLKFKKN